MKRKAKPNRIKKGLKKEPGGLNKRTTNIKAKQPERTVLAGQSE